MDIDFRYFARTILRSMVPRDAPMVFVTVRSLVGTMAIDMIWQAQEAKWMQNGEGDNDGKRKTPAKESRTTDGVWSSTGNLITN